MTGSAETLRSDRRADIDSLRVCALLLLIVYHVLLVFNSWDFWRVKSEHAGYWADYITGILTPWRMSLVFFVGGVAARYMISRMRPGAFVLDRAGKLLTAFVFAVVVLVPLQRYVRLDNTGATPMPYLDYLLHQARYVVSHAGMWLPDFAHAWFLPYLFVYAALAAAFFHVLPTAFARAEQRFDALPAWVIVGGVMIWFSLIEVAVWPQYPVSGLLFPDVGAHVKFAPLFFLGFLLGRSEAFTRKLVAMRTPLCLTAATLFAVSVALQWTEVGMDATRDARALGWFFARGLYGGAMLFSVVAFGAWALNKPSNALTYATDAILPVYLMHQTVLVIVADRIVGHGLALADEIIVLLAATALIPLLIYHLLIRHTAWLRVLFGLRAHPRAPQREGQDIVGQTAH
ncbi:acyltransferase family protein [Terricaulis sp.]|uniref:acyltransferase family protein n=1 Tax=Terricaulis sp. TaxID=2768686 RepID=UPI0037831518